MSSSDSEEWECPLCMEEMDIDDRGFFPCECGYQICRFCHNRISQDYGGRCPACRRLYSEQTPRWKPISAAQIAKIKNEKKAKERERREIEGNNRRHLANVRVVQKNLVYVIGLPIHLATEEILKGHDYFGQFGRINKIVISKRQGNNSHHQTVGVYVTYATKEEATKAINAVDGSVLEGRVLRAAFGTTKYCSYYLRSIPCQNPNCMYLHEPGEEADSFTKEDLAANRANLRDDENDEPSEADQMVNNPNRSATRSPNANLGTGRVMVVPTSSFPGFSSRPQSTNPPQSSSTASATAARLRKSSDLHGTRPKSVEPSGSGDGDHSTGSALPATASWASKSSAKRTTQPDSADSRSRKSEGGAMTLRMVPSSRSKNTTAAMSAPSSATKPPSGVTAASVVAGSTIRDKTKGGGMSATITASTVAAAAAAGSAGGMSSQSHHPALQQLSRERKEQLRQQQQLAKQQAEIEANSAANDTAANGKKDIGSKSKKPHSEPAGHNTLSSDIQTADVSDTKRARSKDKDKDHTNGAAAKTDIKAKSKHPDDSQKNSTKEANQKTIAKTVDGKEDRDGLLSAPNTVPSENNNKPKDLALTGPDDNQESAEKAPKSNGLEAADSTAGAQSFQSIADSLFAQLNAKVSTPTSNNIPSFSPTMQLGASVANPISKTDPLLFPPTTGTNAVPGYSSGSLGMNPPPFNPFMGRASHWGGNTAPGPSETNYSPSPLSTFLGDNSVGAPGPLGGNRDGLNGSMAYPSRQRSRWDFAHVDEASAQAELQSVLGRGLGAGIGMGDQVAQASGQSLLTPRDLGLFATPVSALQRDNLWGGRGLGNPGIEGQHQDVNGTTPVPPPGFGAAAQSTDVNKVATGGFPSLVSSPLPNSAPAMPLGDGQNTLLSRLIGQSGPMAATLGNSIGGPSLGSAPISADHQQHQLRQGVTMFHDPAILTSYISNNTGVMASGKQAEAHQQQQQISAQMFAQQMMPQAQMAQQLKNDPNVLNSLLARLQLGQTVPGAPPGVHGAPPMTSATAVAGIGQFGGVMAGGIPGGAMLPDMQQQQQQQQQQQKQQAIAGGNIIQSPLLGQGSPGGFVDPAIMHVGRLHQNGSKSPVTTEPPPGISPLLSNGGRIGVDGHNASGNQQQPPQMGGLPGMVSRSANSSGRSRFLTHFSADTAGGGERYRTQQQVSSEMVQRLNNNGSPGVEGKEAGMKAAGMVNGVPPGLPTTGLFGELLRRTRQEAGNPAAAGAGVGQMNGAEGNVISGKMMLGDIERKLDTARREAQELQAQLNTVIGQNQSALWALTNAAASAAAAATAQGSDGELPGNERKD